MTGKIVRVWGARAGAGAAAYERHFRENVLPKLTAISGHLAATLLRRDIGDQQSEFLVLTEWLDLEAIRRFAGNDLERAIVAEEAAAMLTEWDKDVRHYQVVSSADLSGVEPEATIQGMTSR